MPRTKGAKDKKKRYRRTRLQKWLDELEKRGETVRSASEPPPTTRRRDNRGQPAAAPDPTHEVTNEVDIPDSTIEDSNPGPSNIVDLYLMQVAQLLGDRRSLLRKSLTKGTFWKRPPNPCVELRKAMKSQLHKPTAYPLYLPDVFFWIPKDQFGIPIPCARATCDGKGKRCGYSKPRRVVSTDRCYYVFSSRHICDKCGKTYMATNPAVMDRFPLAMRTKTIYPFHLSHRMGLDLSVLDEMETQIGTLTGGNFSTYRDSLFERHALHATHLELMYTSALSSKEFRENEALKHEPERFDRDQLSDHVPSSQYLAEIMLMHLKRNRPHMIVEMIKRSGNMLAIDHSHKFIKMLNRSNGSKIFDSALQGCNEYGEIVFMMLSLGTGHDSVKQAIKRFMTTRRALGQPDPVSVATDKCCTDRPMLEEAIPSLKRADPAACPRLPDMELPENWKLLKTAAEVRSLILCWNHSISQLKSLGDTLVVGLDCEWVAHTANGTRGRVATIQLATDDQVHGKHGVLIHMAVMRSMPTELRSFLKRTDVIFCGRQIRMDRRHIANDFGIEELENDALCSNWKELGALANRRTDFGAVAGLAELCRRILRKKLLKDSTIRCSAWDQRQLSNEQVKYAILDAFASVQLYHALMAKRDRSLRVGKPDDSGQLIEPEVGDYVELMPQGRGSRHVIAKCRIVALYDPDKSPPVRLYETNLSSTRVQVSVVKIEASEAYVPYRDTKLADAWEEHEGPFDIIAPMNRLCPCNQASGDENEDEDDWMEPFEMADDPDPAFSQRVLNDVFHAMEHIPVEVRHPMSGTFSYMMSLAIFAEDVSIRGQVHRVLREKGVDIREKRANDKEYFRKRIPRVVKDPDTIAQHAGKVFVAFESVAEFRGIPLFRSNYDDEKRKFLDHVRKGCLSDPPNLSMYHEIGKDSDGLRLFRCLRGTVVGR